MFDISTIKGIIFDYGATIDTNGLHWAEVLWEGYEALEVPVKKSEFRDAYIYGERYLATHPVVQPNHSFKDVLLSKTDIQLKRLVEQGFLPAQSKISEYSLAISNHCYNFVLTVIEKAKPVLDRFASRYPLVLVSNFYGNIETVLKEFSLDSYFCKIIESVVVGIRKPDPRIFSLGVEYLGFKPEEVVVVGDSYKKDILPARSIACRTIWLKGKAWDEEPPTASADVIITDFQELKKEFRL